MCNNNPGVRFLTMALYLSSPTQHDGRGAHMRRQDEVPPPAQTHTLPQKKTRLIEHSPSPLVALKDRAAGEDDDVHFFRNYDEATPRFSGYKIGITTSGGNKSYYR